MRNATSVHCLTCLHTQSNQRERTKTLHLTQRFHTLILTHSLCRWTPSFRVQRPAEAFWCRQSLPRGAEDTGFPVQRLSGGTGGSNICIWVVLGSNLGRNVGYPEVIIGIPPSRPVKSLDSTRIRLWLLPSTSFPIHHSPIILPFSAIYSSYWQRR
jgi:hypothetical protein